MKKNIFILLFLSISLSLASTNLESLDNDRSLIVHKTPTCGCCKKWMKHLESQDFEMSPEDHQNLLPIKEKFGIKPEYRSCHTAVSKEGYVFEGHIPGKYISQFLAEKIRNNEIDISDKSFIDFLYKLTEKKIDIDNPKYKKFDTP